MKRYFVLIIALFLASCSGDAIPNITPTVGPSTFVPTNIVPPTIVSSGTPVTPTPSATRTATATRTPTRTPTTITNTPRPPTVTPIGTLRAGQTPGATPDCRGYDCGPVDLPNLPLLDSPTPYNNTPSPDNEIILSPTPDPRTRIAEIVTPIVVNGTEIGVNEILEPIDLDTLGDVDDLGNNITPMGEGGFGAEGDFWGNGGLGLGFDGENNPVGFGNNPNDTIWIAYVKGLFDPNVNYFGPFSPLVALLITYISLNFIFIVANLFIPLLAIVVRLFVTIVTFILKFVPFVG